MIPVVLGACVSSSVGTGAAIGAVSGLALGSGVGVVISDADLLGSPATLETGDTSIDPAAGIGAGALLGALFGAIVGAMLGKGQEGPSYGGPADADQPSPAVELGLRRMPSGVASPHSF